MRANTRKVLKDRHAQLKVQMDEVNAQIDYQKSMIEGAVAGLQTQKTAIKDEMDMIKAELDAEPETPA